MSEINNIRHECLECELDYSDKKSLDRHIKNTHNNEKIHKCNKCDKLFYQNNILMKHMKNKHIIKSINIENKQGKIVYNCMECEYIFSSKQMLNNHINNIHSLEKTHECDICHKLFYNEYYLNKHFKTIHPNENRIYSCDKCDIVCSSKGNLVAHINGVHLKIRENICTYENCGKGFQFNKDLQEHINGVHLDIRSYICNYDNCVESFHNSGNLQRHINTIHLDVINFTCYYKNCNFTCYGKSHLDVHINSSIHKDIRNFVCSYNECKQEFHAKGHMLDHINQVHLLITNFECNRCTLSFYDKTDFNRHSEICSGNSPYSGLEFNAIKILKEYNIDFIYNKSYDNLKSIKGNCVRFDFILDINDSKMFIECDGKQHFSPSTFGGISIERAEENFVIQQQNDKIKDNYCQENNFPLLRIPYTIPFNDYDYIINSFIFMNSIDIDIFTN